eukprot:1194112-Pyramimonas_sp.AAC.1
MGHRSWERFRIQRVKVGDFVELVWVDIRASSATLIGPHLARVAPAIAHVAAPPNTSFHPVLLTDL